MRGITKFMIGWEISLLVLTIYGKRSETGKENVNNRSKLYKHKLHTLKNNAMT
jgi:hypothetical protein